jgi:hypothetical protein
MGVKYDFKELNKFLKRVSDPKRLDKRLTVATKNIAKVLHQHLVEQTPVKTGNLKKMWSAGDNLKFTVNRTDTGYEVVLINAAEYASSVNDGHYSYNQYNVGGKPYVVKNRTVPYRHGGKDKTFVFGRFFVEDSIDLTYPKVEEIVMKELDKWWDSV